MVRTVLVADDEAKIVSLVAGYLEAAGYEVVKVYSGTESLKLFRERTPDCLILDINMPGLDGMEVAREIRKTSTVPIVFLTARTDEVDRLVGFEIGADDYVMKPFSPRELVARVKAIMRRESHRESTESSSPVKIVRGSFVLDAARRTLTHGGKPVELTAVQFDLLAFMMRESGRVWSRLELLGASSGSAFDGYERTIDAHVKNIRRALGDDSDAPRYIETVRGIGYRFMEQSDED